VSLYRLSWVPFALLSFPFSSFPPIFALWLQRTVLLSVERFTRELTMRDEQWRVHYVGLDQLGEGRLRFWMGGLGHGGTFWVGVGMGDQGVTLGELASRFSSCWIMRLGSKMQPLSLASASERGKSVLTATRQSGKPQPWATLGIQGSNGRQMSE
jgi:hypothetical protein